MLNMDSVRIESLFKDLRQIYELCLRKSTQKPSEYVEMNDGWGRIGVR